MSRPRVLVTGAGGFLGGYVCRRLAAQDFEVIAHGRTVKSVGHWASAGYQTVACDLESTDAIAGLESVGRLDAVVHCAGLSSNWGERLAFQSANVDATRNLLAQVRRNGVPHFVYISSSSVCFDFEDRLLVKEDQRLPKPVNDYAWSKRAAEEVVSAVRDLPASIIRPRGIYGHGDQALLPRLLRAASRGPLPLFRDGTTVIDLTHVEDVAAAIVAVVQSRPQTIGKTYNVSGGEPIEVRNIIEQAAVRADVKVKWRPIPWSLARVAIASLEQCHRVFCPAIEPYVTVYSAGLLAFSQTLDISSIRRDAGWVPAISLADGLARTFGPQ